MAFVRNRDHDKFSLLNRLLIGFTLKASLSQDFPERFDNRARLFPIPRAYDDSDAGSNQTQRQGAPQASRPSHNCYVDVSFHCLLGTAKEILRLRAEKLLDRSILT